MVFCSLIASSAIRAFISALKVRRCLDFISAPFPRQRFYTLLSGLNFGEHFTRNRLPSETSSTPVPHRGHYSVLSVVADRERLIRWPRYLLLTGAHIHNRSSRRTSQIRDNLETVAAEKALEIAISSKL